jgi:hypothetical protein
MLWPFTAELFFFPSLSEKGVVIGAAVLLWWCSASHRISSNAVYWLSLLAGSAFAFTTKTQILVFVPAVVLTLWLVSDEDATARRRPRAWFAIAWILLMSSLVTAVALTGTYTQATQGSMGVSFASDRRFLGLLALTVLFGLGLVFRKTRGTFRPTDFIPVLLLLSMCGAFAIWDMRNYFLSIAGVMVGAVFGTVAAWTSDSNKARVLTVLLTVCALIWLTIRLPTVYSSLASVGSFLSSNIAQQLSDESARVFVTCSEAPQHYNGYQEHFGLSGIRFTFLDYATLEEAHGDKVDYVFADTRLCAWQPTSSQWQVVWSGGGAGAFQLFHLATP